MEESLSGGNATSLVVRVDGTVRKPWFDGASGVLEYMRDLRQRGAAKALRASVDGYHAEAGMRRALPDALVRRTWAMYELLRDAHRDGVDPWGSCSWRATASTGEQLLNMWSAARNSGVTRSGFAPDDLLRRNSVEFRFSS